MNYRFFSSYTKNYFTLKKGCEKLSMKEKTEFPVYCFYLLDKEEITPEKYPGVISDTVSIENGFFFSLYAYTKEKKLRNHFKKTRDMTKFIEKVIYMEPKTYEEFMDQYSEYILESHSILTKQKIDGVYTKTMANLKCTSIEFEDITTLKDFYISDIFGNSLNLPMILMITNNVFQKKLMEALVDILGVDSLITDWVVPMEEITRHTDEVDELSLYIELFANTYLKGE